jgi:hypothetical protein
MSKLMLVLHREELPNSSTDPFNTDEMAREETTANKF